MKNCRVHPTHWLISTQVTLTLGPLLRWWTLHRATCPLDHVLMSFLGGLFLLSTVATIMGLTFGTLAALIVSPISMLAGSAAWRLGVICDGIARWSAFCFVEEMWLLFALRWFRRKRQHRFVLCGNQPVRRVHRQFFTKSFLGDGAAVLARSSGEELASPRRRAGVASMAWRTTRRFSTNAP